MIRRIFYTCLLMVMLAGPAFGVDLKLKACLRGLPQITDIKFAFPGHAFITTQSGEVYWFQGDHKKPQKIATINVATSSWELGLYSVAVDPDFFWSTRLFLYYAIETDGQLKTRLSAFKLNPDDIPNGLMEEKILLEIDQPYTDGNGGALQFGPDGLLYLSVGDGGSEGDPDGNAQNIQSILGSIVRIKPDFSTEKGYTIPDGNLQDFIPGALPEIFVYGVHNPWKFTFDDQENLIIADVGEHLIEEIDIISRNMIGTQAINLGWKIKEGDICYNPPEGCDSKGMIDPVYQYKHDGDSGNAITGGETILSDGKEYYVFADYMTGQISMLDLEAPKIPVFEKHFKGNWTTFAKDSLGHVYVADYDRGIVYQVLLRP